MILSLLLLALPQEANHLASYVQPSGHIMGEHAFADADGDGDLDLYLPILSEGKRFIDIHYQHQARVYSAVPDEHIEISPAVVSWNVGDFLPGEEEPGCELLLLASRGAYVRTQQGRPKALLRALMLLDMPSSDSLPLWEAMADIDGDGFPEVALATADGFQIMDQDGSLLGEIPHPLASERQPMASGSYLGGMARPTLSSQTLADLFLPNEDLGVIARPPALFSFESLPTPVWSDADGDGRLDLSFLQGVELTIHRQDEAGRFDSEPWQVIELPHSEESDFEQVDWVDVGGGPAADLLLVRSSEDILRQTRPWQVRVYLDLARREDLVESDAFFKVDSTFLWVFLEDLDQDGRRDVCLSNWSLDLALLGRGAPSIDHRVTGFLADRSGWSSRAAFEWERTFHAEDFESLVLMDSVVQDLTGDGRPDLLERSKAGSLEVRRFLEHPSGLTVAKDVSTEIPINALAASIDVQDLNDDGVGDLIVRRDKKFEIHLSYRR